MNKAIIQKSLQLIEKISPKLNAKIAFHFMSNPPAAKFRKFEKPILEKSKRSILSFKQNKIMVHEWGEGDNNVLLVHGMGGRTSNYGAIIPLLIQHGYRVIGFDSPGHGESSNNKTQFFDNAELVQHFLEKHDFDLIISHSMGSVMTMIGMNNMNYNGKKLIMLTTLERFEKRLDYWIINFLGLSYKTKDALMDYIRKTTSYEPLDLTIEVIAKGINMEKVVIIHDINDSQISIEESKTVQQHLKNTELIEISDTGHFKMLWSDKTIKHIEDIITKY